MRTKTSSNELGEISALLRNAVSLGFNVLIEGPHGCGKSSVVRAVVADLGLTLKYFSAPTLDPFADLVGIPVPLTDADRPRLRFLRDDSIQSAEVIFVDELGRAHPKTLNAVFEMIQFRTINGERLPQLRSIIAATNLTGDGYDVTELDPALVDRFHLYVRLTAGPDRKWFVSRFGEQVGHALVDWYETDLDEHQRKQVSHRRLEYIGISHQSNLDLMFALHPDLKLPLHLLWARLKQDEGTLDIEDFVDDSSRFLSAVSSDVSVAMRFSDLLPRMTPKQKSAVKEITLALPAEVLAKLKREAPFVFKSTREAVRQHEDAGEAKAFWDLIQERLNKI